MSRPSLPDWIRYAAKASDFRDRYIIAKGCLFLLLGYAIATAQVPKGARNPLDFVLRWVPLPLAAYGWLFIVGGALMIAAAMFPGDRWRPAGFFVAYLLPALWGWVYVIPWLLGYPGRPWFYAAFFGFLAYAAYCVSAMDGTRMEGPR